MARKSRRDAGSDPNELQRLKSANDSLQTQVERQDRSIRALQQLLGELVRQYRLKSDQVGNRLQTIESQLGGVTTGVTASADRLRQWTPRKIAIVGIFSDQFETLKSSLHAQGLTAELAFIDKDRLRYPKVDEVVVITKFIRHEVEDQIVSKYGKTHVYKVGGTGVQLKRKLFELAQGA
jgi:hypothetical protein